MLSISRRFGTSHANRRADLLGGEEGGRVDDLVRVGKRELLVLGEQVVQVRGAAAPVAEDENGRVLDRGRGDLGAMTIDFPACVPGVE